MKENLEENFYIRVIEFCLKKPDGFEEQDIINNENLKLRNWEKEIIKRYFETARLNYQQNVTYGKGGYSETLFIVIRVSETNLGSRNKYNINFDAYFKYYDYLELKFARENAQSAKKLAFYALGLSIISIITAFSIPFLTTQTVKLDPNQFNEIQTIFKNKE